MQQRALGPLEKYAVYFQEYFSGTSTISVAVKIQNKIEFTNFQQAFALLFEAQPMLRARVTSGLADMQFTFDAKLSNVEIEHYQSPNEAEINALFSTICPRKMDITKSLWRACLVDSGTQQSHIIISASHAISDGRSLFALCVQALNIIDALVHNTPPEYPVFNQSPCIEAIIQVNKDAVKKDLPAFNLEFMEPNKKVTASTKNIWKVLPENQFAPLLAKARENETTITGAILAAISLAFKEEFGAEHNLFSAAASLRSSTTDSVPTEMVSYYADRVEFIIEQNQDDFWALAKQCLLTLKEALANYQPLLSATVAELEGFKNTFESYVDKNICHIPPILTNAGNLDSMCKDIKGFKVSEAFFTIKNHLLFSFVLATASINNSLCLNFNYCTAVLSDAKANKLSNNIIEKLLQHSM
jgi:hypothetical protein